MSGYAPFTPENMSYTVSGGKAPYTVIVYYGDGGSLDVSPGKLWPAHTYNTSGTFTVQITATDADGKTASDSKTIVVYPSATATSTVASTTSSSTQGPTLIPAITACDPAFTIIMLIVTIVVAVLIVKGLTFLIGGRLRFRTRLIVAIIVAGVVWFFFGAAFILGPGGVCNPVTVWLMAIILIILVIVLFRNWLIGPPLPPPPPWPPGMLRPNVAGNATLTTPNGNRTQLTNRTVNQITRGSTVQTGNHSFVRMQTPQGSNSQTTIGENSSLSWLDPTTYMPWLRFPPEWQYPNIERLLLEHNFGKLLFNWMETDAAKEALLILPAGLMGLAASAATSRWLARVKGTMLLLEATKDGTSAAITVLEDPAKPGSVELWRSDETGKVIEIRSGERVILKTGQPPTKMSVDLAGGLVQQIQDPFNVLHKWWTLPPASNESLTAVETPSISPKPSIGTNVGDVLPGQNAFCIECGQPLPKPNAKFCTKCGAAQT
jgi:hypothetical protein